MSGKSTETLTLERKLECAKSALRVILTWAAFEYEDLPRGHALVPKQVENLVKRTLEEIG